MIDDCYPMSHLVKRLFDVALFSIAAVSLMTAIAIGYCADHSKQKMVIGLGMVASVIGALLDYRQKAVYDNDHVEVILLSNGFQDGRLLTKVAKLRHKLVAADILIVVAGMLVSGYGGVW